MNENNNEIYLNNTDYDILTEQLFSMPDNHLTEKDLNEIKSRQSDKFPKPLINKATIILQCPN